MRRIRFLANHIGLAGLVTLGSLLAAWSAIWFVLHNITKLAIVFSVIAFCLDSFDGFLARKLGTASEFGRFFDSMVDAINYSVLAALVTQQVLLPTALGFVTGFLILACGILRLVLFTVQGFEVAGDKTYYTGVVTPHLTLTVAIIFLIKKFTPIPDAIIASVLIVLALAQLSTLKTKKTGVLLFWIPASLALAVGSLIWL